MRKEMSMWKKVSWSFAYGIGMALLEAIVVVYLRELYYPQGFAFPLKNMDWNITMIEILREAGTILMLVCVSALAAENFYTWVGFFLFNFAVWDIFYYVWLKVLLNWPANFLEWDILFLIPITWDGPVIAPLLCSVAMLALAGVIFYFHQHKVRVSFTAKEWGLFVSGSLLVFTSFIWNYTHFMIDGGYFKDLANLGNNSQFIEAVENFLPPSFQWGFFLPGYGLIVGGIVLLALRLGKNLKTGRAG